MYIFRPTSLEELHTSPKTDFEKIRRFNLMNIAMTYSMLVLRYVVHSSSVSSSVGQMCYPFTPRTK